MLPLTATGLGLPISHMVASIICTPRSISGPPPDWASNVQQDDRFFELRGTKAGASFHSTDNKLKIFTEQYGKTMDLIPNLPGAGNGHFGNIQNFADVINGVAEPVYRPEQGLNMIRILEVIYESARTGREVVL